MALQGESVLGALLLAAAVAVAAAGHLHRAFDPVEGLGGDVPGAPRVEHRPQGEGQARAQIRRPVHDEEDVPRLLLHDLVEDRDQVLVKELAAASEVEEAEGEEDEALSVSGAQKRPRRILRLLRLAERSGRDPVVLRQQSDDLGVAPFFVALQGDGFLQHRVRLGVPEGLHLDRRGGLGSRRLVPDEGPSASPGSPRPSRARRCPGAGRGGVSRRTSRRRDGRVPPIRF